MKFIALNENKRVVSMNGSCAHLTKGVPRELHGRLAEAAMSTPGINQVINDDVDAAELEAKKQAEAEAKAEAEAAAEAQAKEEADAANEGAARFNKIVAAVQKLVDVGNKDNFTAQGNPRVSAVMEITEFDVNSTEAREALEAIPQQ